MKRRESGPYSLVEHTSRVSGGKRDHPEMWAQMVKTEGTFAQKAWNIPWTVIRRHWGVPLRRGA